MTGVKDSSGPFLGENEDKKIVPSSLTNRFSFPRRVVLLEILAGKPLLQGMKCFSLTTLSFLLGLSLVCAGPLEKRPGSKITKNEAQHIALRPHKGARVTAARLETIEGKKIWVIQIALGKHEQTVQVNAVTGRIVPTENFGR